MKTAIVICKFCLIADLNSIQASIYNCIKMLFIVFLHWQVGATLWAFLVPELFDIGLNFKELCL